MAGSWTECAGTSRQAHGVQALRHPPMADGRRARKHLRSHPRHRRRRPAELARAAARGAAAAAVPARKGPRAGQPVHPREISFTAARRAIIATTRAGAATASLPAALTSANLDHALTALARSRVQADRDRHRDRKTKARQGFPAGGPRLPARAAPARVAVCGPLRAAW